MAAVERWNRKSLLLVPGQPASERDGGGDLLFGRGGEARSRDPDLSPAGPDRKPSFPHWEALKVQGGKDPISTAHPESSHSGTRGDLRCLTEPSP